MWREQGTGQIEGEELGRGRGAKLQVKCDKRKEGKSLEKK